MKDTITLLVMNAIRYAEHKTNEKGAQLTDQEVLQIAVKAQFDYHQGEAMRFMNSYGGQMNGSQGKPKVSAAGQVTPPADLHRAARESLGDDYERFVAEVGDDFTPKQLCEFVEREVH